MAKKHIRFRLQNVFWFLCETERRLPIDDATLPRVGDLKLQSSTTTFYAKVEICFLLMFLLREINRHGTEIDKRKIMSKFHSIYMQIAYVWMRKTYTYIRNGSPEITRIYWSAQGFLNFSFTINFLITSIYIYLFVHFCTAHIALHDKNPFVLFCLVCGFG